MSVEEFNKAVTFNAPVTRKTLWRKEMSNLVTYLTQSKAGQASIHKLMRCLALTAETEPMDQEGLEFLQEEGASATKDIVNAAE